MPRPALQPLQLTEIADNARNAVRSEMRGFCRTLLRDGLRTKFANSVIDNVLKTETDTDGPGAPCRVPRLLYPRKPARLRQERRAVRGSLSPATGSLGGAGWRALKVSSPALRKAPPSAARSPGRLLSPSKQAVPLPCGRAPYLGAEEDGFLAALRARRPSKDFQPCSARIRAQRLGYGGDAVATHSLLAALDRLGIPHARAGDALHERLDADLGAQHAASLAGAAVLEVPPCPPPWPLASCTGARSLPFDVLGRCH